MKLNLNDKKRQTVVPKSHEFPSIHNFDRPQRIHNNEKMIMNLQNIQKHNKEVQFYIIFEQQEHLKQNQKKQDYQGFSKSNSSLLSKEEFVNTNEQVKQKASDLKRSQFVFLTETRLLKKPFRPQINCNIVEQTIEHFKLQKKIMEFGELQQQDESTQSSQWGISTGYAQRSEIMGKFQLEDQLPTKGLNNQEIIQYRNQQLKRLDEKVQMINEGNILQYQWQSPFLVKQDSVQRMPIRKIMADAYQRGLNGQQLNESVASIQGEIKFTREEQDDELVIAAIQMHKVFKGYGFTFHSILDKDRQQWRFYQRCKGNPKFLNRGELLNRLQNKSNKYLDMTQEWNKLLAMEKLHKNTNLIRSKEEPEIKSPTSISQFQSFQGFRSKIASMSKKASLIRREMPSIATPSIISGDPQFVLRNSTGSDSQSRRDMDLFTVKDQGVQESESEQIITSDNTTVSKDTFLTFFSTFWGLMRKEDPLVERVVWALSKQDKPIFIDFRGFRLFYQIFVFQDWYIISFNNIKSNFYQKQNFVFDVIWGDNEDEISFIEIQGIIKLLCLNLDNLICRSQETIRNTAKDLLSNQLLESIVEKIHRPQILQKNIIQELIEDEKLPPDTLIRLLYDDNNL